MGIRSILFRFSKEAGANSLQVRDLIAAGDVARDAREWSEAADHYREALELNPRMTHIWVQYGHTLKESGDLAGAEGAYRKALSIEPNIADTHLNLGHALKLSSRKSEAGESYLHALKLDNFCIDAFDELRSLGWSSADIRSRLHDQGGELVECDKDAIVVPQIIFDISDLAQYFQNARIPTGIQRVQMNIINALLTEPRDDVAIAIACFAEGGDGWIKIPNILFQRITALAIGGGDINAPEWSNARREVWSTIALGAPCSFAPGAFLVNLGTSWWLQNYFLYIRNLKRNFGIRYYPFVHDLIPILTPEHCVKELTQDFISWLLGVFHHADGYFANSRATAIDLQRVASFLGHQSPSPAVIPLDGRSSSIGGGEKRHALSQLADIGDLVREPYVLFVSTIESRKNHLLTFSVWLSMIQTRGLARTPTLVCVGNHGWLVDAAMAKLNSSDLLRKKVRLLSKVSDSHLEALYKNCLFTIMPSAYEGWGLPVTESLCQGKVPLVANSSSLPEAGGVFADYFDVRSERDFQEKLERLIDDESYRKNKERKISEEFKPRSWRQVADQIVDNLLGLPKAEWHPDGAAGGIFPVEDGQYYSLTRNRERVIWPGMKSGEIYRIGTGWDALEDCGSRLNHKGAELAMRLPPGLNEACILYLFLESPDSEACGFADVTVDISKGPVWTGEIAGGTSKTVRIRLESDFVRSGFIHLRFSFDKIRRDGDDNNEGTISVALRGFYLCREDSLNQRLSLFECLSLGDMRSLNGHYGISPIPKD